MLDLINIFNLPYFYVLYGDVLWNHDDVLYHPSFRSDGLHGNDQNDGDPCNVCLLYRSVPLKLVKISITF